MLMRFVTQSMGSTGTISAEMDLLPKLWAQENADEQRFLVVARLWAVFYGAPLCAVIPYRATPEEILC
jgi:hypothetical protein